MAKLTKPLTNTEVSQAKPKDKEYNLSDCGGLAMRVKANGTKTWLFNYYHPHTNKRSKISFGAFPSVSLKQAREIEMKLAHYSHEISIQSHTEKISSEKLSKHTITRLKMSLQIGLQLRSPLLRPLMLKTSSAPFKSTSSLLWEKPLSAWLTLLKL